MRRLTFEGFLESYVQHLAGERTRSVRKLAERAAVESRLYEPLLLWAAVSGHADQLARLLGGQSDRVEELEALVALHRLGALESALAQDDSGLPSEYAKVWRSFVVRRDAPERDAALKHEARRQVLVLEAETGVSRYRMAKDLGLNPGNLHAFLAQANVSKLSLENAYALVRYLRAA